MAHRTDFEQSAAMSVRYVSSEKSWCPGVSRMLMQHPSYSNCSTELVTEIPLCFSISIQSDTACLAVAFPLTLPARLIAPPYSRNFSVSVVLPASGWEMIANVRLRAISCAVVDIIYSPASMSVSYDRIMNPAKPAHSFSNALARRVVISPITYSFSVCSRPSWRSSVFPFCPCRGRLR